MPHGTDTRSGEPSPALKQNQILSTPATVAACAADYRTPADQQHAAGAARNQSAFARIAAGDH